MSDTSTTANAVPGDVLEVSGPRGLPARKGEILELVGRTSHPHFRVRWEDGHESLYFPADGGAHVIHHGKRRLV